MNMDQILIIMFAAAAVTCRPLHRQQALESVAFFSVICAVAGYTINAPWPWMHFAVMWAIGALWAWRLADQLAIIPAIAVAGDCVLMVIMTIDRLVWPSEVTDLYSSYESASFVVNLTILSAIIWQGRSGGDLRVFGRRRDDCYIKSSDGVAEK